MLTLDDQIRNLLPPKYPSTDQIVNDNEKRRQEGFNGAVNKAHKLLKKAAREGAILFPKQKGTDQNP